jgi:putative ABC transport system permease protein
MVEDDLREQIEAHREMIRADLIGRGVSAAEAERAARQAFGNDAIVQESTRDELVHRVVDEAIRDFRQGIRALIKNPAFTVAAVVSLAFGVGANTFIFSLINSSLLNPLGYPNPERLAAIWTVPTQDGVALPNTTSSVSKYFALRDMSRSFDELGAFNGAACGLRSLGADRDGTTAERVYGQCFSPSLFRILGVKPLLGRTFTDEEDRVGNVAPVVLISYALWQQRFGSDAAIVGRTILLNQVSTTVIGVLPPDFRLFRDPNIPLASRTPQIDFIAPLELGPTQVNSRVGGNTIVGRLKAGVSLAQAQSEIDAISGQLGASDPVRYGGLGSRIQSLQEVVHRDYRSPLLLLQGAVAFVLLISCANVAGLLLARNAVRRHEIGLRTALGANRRRIVRQLAMESLPLAIAGGAIGVFVASFGISFLVKLAPADFPQLQHAAIDWRVLVFTALVVVAASILFAVLPAMQAVRADVIDPLRESTRTASGGVHRQRARSLLVTGQIALALVLLIGAGLMINSFVRVLKNDLGADPANLLVFLYSLPPAETIKPIGMYRGMGLATVYPKPALMSERVLERLETIPGVLSAAGTNTAPFSGQAASLPFLIEGRPAPFPANTAAPLGQNAQAANYFAVTRGFFGLMKIPIVRGRDFDAHDNATGRLVMIVNEAMASRFFPNEDPIGKQITLDFVPEDRPREIVGIAANTVTGPLQATEALAMYVPHLQQTSQWIAPYWGARSGMYFLVRTASEPSNLISAIKAAVAEVDRNTPASDLITGEQTLANQTRTMRFYMFLFGIFAAVAALLAAIGIYGVVAYSVAERTREIGIRMALGGRTRDIFAMVLRQAGWIIGIGLAAGLAGAFALTRLIQSLLFRITATDARTYIVISLLLLAIAAIACLIPARRAATVDPVLALKHE